METQWVFFCVWLLLLSISFKVRIWELQEIILIENSHYY